MSVSTQILEIVKEHEYVSCEVETTKLLNTDYKEEVKKDLILKILKGYVDRYNMVFNENMELCEKKT